MIEAYFALSVGNNPDPCAASTTYTDGEVGCVFPDEETLETARLLGYDEDALFSVHQPSGLSRVGRVRCVVSAEDLPQLYRSTIVVSGARYKAAATFKWRDASVAEDGSAKAFYEMPVWLMPPRPLYAVPTRPGTPPSGNVVTVQGLFLVEAVDIRHWWSMSPTDANVRNAHHSYDFRYSESNLSANASRFASVDAMLDYYLENLPIRSMTRSGSITNDQSSIAELPALPDMSPAAIIDYALAQLGWHVSSFDLATGVVTIAQIPTLAASNLAATYASDNLIAGGEQANSGAVTGSGSDQLMAFEGGTTSTSDGQWYQLNRTPASVLYSPMWRAVEGRTQTAPGTPATFGYKALAASSRDYTVEASVSTSRCRPTMPAAPVVLTSDAATVGSNYARDVANYATNGNFANPTGVTIRAGNVATALSWRCRAVFGRLASPGFVASLVGGAMGPNTDAVHTIRRYQGEWTPVTLRWLDEDDWIVGPTGKLSSDPRDLVFGRGAALARRLSSGPLLVDVAPPVRRIFAARITGATRLDTTGNGYWRWKYLWEEMQRRTIDPVSGSATFADVNTSQDRKDWNTAALYAANSMEETNAYSGAGAPTNFIAPGYLQSDYAATTMDCLPIATGTIVTMVEDFRDCSDTTPSDAPTGLPYYWFSLPNVPKFNC